MGKCENCVHWYKDEKDDSDIYGACRLISETTRVGIWGGIPYEFSSKIAGIRVDGMRYIDSELRTAPDFGCVQFQDR